MVDPVPPIGPDRYLTRGRVRELLDRHGLAPSRALGQNFLCDPGTINKIVRLANVGPSDRVVEIGAGLGSLTVGLAATGAEVVALEIDRHLIPALHETVDGLGVEVHEADARTFDWGRLGTDSWHVVANLPYNIATPLVLDLLAAQPQLDRWLVMVQREAGERLVAGPGSKIYGIPSVLTALWAEARIVASVSAELFLPRPKVESVLVEIVRHPVPPVELAGGDTDTVIKLVRAGFGQRRKMLRRSLAAHCTVEDLERAGIAPTARAEELGVEQWLGLAATCTDTHHADEG
ncbi:MAG: 16S rRNA (adenine(1518)-N(6)/adenine(1519)-N(6))-dimethyltransferase RsmA [Acidimicrobiales bacterium]